MDPLACLLIFVAAAFLSPLVFAVWQAFQDKKHYKAIKDARNIQQGIPVVINKLSYTGLNFGAKPTAIPIKCQNENLILTGRGFNSLAVAIKMTTEGGPGLLWETKFEQKRLGWLESGGYTYWGILTEEYSILQKLAQPSVVA